MSERKKSQTGFVAVTLITLLAIAMVLVVYSAILLGTPTGKEVTVGGVTGTIYYSTTQSGPWTQETLSVNPAGSAWYAALITPGGQYVGPVSISWQLYKKGTASDWSDENPAGSAQSTSIVLTSGSQTIFVEPYGNDSASNFNWGQSGYGNSPGSYRIVATIQSTG